MKRELHKRVLRQSWILLSSADTDINGDYSFDIYRIGRQYKIRFSLDNDEAECCFPSPFHNFTVNNGNQCNSYYEVEVVADSEEVSNVNAGFICGHCPGDWHAVVNNADSIPDTEGYDGKNFSSYNSASVNNKGLIVFRARSTGDHNPSTGIFVRDMLRGGSIVRQAGRRTLVPQPNNLTTEFIEFPSFPRMSINKDNIATRGNHGPVWKFMLEEDTESRSGNTGLYFNLFTKNDTESLVGASLNLQTGVAKLGNVPEFSSIYQVPGLGSNYSGTIFDVFPGSPAIQDDGTIAFKGNYAKDDASQTGVFYRRLEQTAGGGNAQIYVVANSQTAIPKPTTNCKNLTFGSTASPSIVDSKMVFRGLDIEDDPGCGGIYMANIMDSSNYPDLTTLVSLETNVPLEEDDVTFTNFGEGLSYNGDSVAFFASWGDEVETLLLCCPTTGNKDRRNYCLNNDTNTICNNATAPEGCDSGCYQDKIVPVNQGIFVQDSDDDSITAVAKGSTKDGKE